MFGLEKILTDQLKRLKDEFGLYGVKSEFEAEGSTFRDLVRLRRITAQLGIPLYLKLGGVEAIRDLKDSLELGVDGVIAPMVESSFAVIKFVEAVQAVYKDHPLPCAINIETRTAIENLDLILENAKGKINNVIIGRTDLSDSYFDYAVKPDSPIIFEIIRSSGKKISEAGFPLTVGGSMSAESIGHFKKDKDEWCGLIKWFETRKVIFPASVLFDRPDCLREALKCEEFNILSKKEISDQFMGLDTDRLDNLRHRL